MNEPKRLLKNYYFLDILRLLRDMLWSRLLFPKQVRLIRQPAFIVGKRHIVFGENFNAGPNLRIEVLDGSFLRHVVHTNEENPKLIIGDNVSVNFNVHIGVLQKVELGDNVLIASNVMIIDHNHGQYKGREQDTPFSAPKDRKSIPENIYIGNNTWIGENVSILPGTHIREGCIVAANSVVSGVFEKHQIIAGAPARPVKKYDGVLKQWLPVKAWRQ